MSNLSDSGGGARLSDRNQLAKRLEKSNFAQTCSLLSKFLKEKRNFSDLIPEKIETPRKKARDEVEKPKVTATTMINSRTSMVNSADNSKDNLPQFIGFSPSGISDDSTNKGEFRRPATPEHVTAQMTIFYAGKVMVYDEFPNEMAKEIMAMANKGSRSSNPATVEVAPNKSSSSAHHISVEKPSGSSLAGEPNVVSKTQPAVLMKPTQEQQLKPQPEAKNSEMPIARRASLHRFLTKRKDRSVAIAPYQVNQQPETSYKASGTREPEPEPEPEEDLPRRQLDLNF